MIRGEVYRATLRPRSGSEQRGTRPVIVVSHDGFNQTPNWRSVIVVPVSSSSRQAARGPTSVALEKGSGGLTADSVALCHQVATLDRGKLTQRLGLLDRGDMERIESGLKAALDLM
jgi:mRNA interferase MazF